ncbi:MAG TPA: type II toxin-antitoxin system prevent-host-death family antitoxin [Candidatus Limnocylindrales bacterium]
MARYPTGDEHQRRPERVGVRELRQNLSVYLRRIEAGETLEVTEHGRPVARLSPLQPTKTSVLERLIAEGRATPPANPGGVASLPPPIKLPPGTPTLSEILAQMRDEDER